MFLKIILLTIVIVGLLSPELPSKCSFKRMENSKNNAAALMQTATAWDVGAAAEKVHASATIKRMVKRKAFLD